MSGEERLGLRRLIDAARRDEIDPAILGPHELDKMLHRIFPDYEPVLMEERPGDWMPQCRIQPILATSLYRPYGWYGDV